MWPTTSWRSLTKRQNVVLLSCRGAALHLDRCGFIGKAVGRSCKHVPDFQWLTVRNRAIGSTVGNNVCRPFPSNITGGHGVARSDDADQAHFRSHSGPGRVPFFMDPPTQVEYTVQPVLFRTLLLERTRLPIQVTESRCECGSPLNKLGRHRGACPRSRRLRSRALPTERTMARAC